MMFWHLLLCRSAVLMPCCLVTCCLDHAVLSCAVLLRSPHAVTQNPRTPSNGTRGFAPPDGRIFGRHFVRGHAARTRGQEM
uniref:Putative secreted protein n=1 Tax=Ixodes ricinus TaxID=34613 RepID=A0A6B0UDJ8_IXORI